MLLSGRRLLRTSQNLRTVQAALADGGAAMQYAQGAPAARLHALASLPERTPLASAQQQPYRALSAAQMLMEDARSGGKGGQAAAAPPPAAASGAPPPSDDDASDFEEEDAAEDAMAEAFERLIQAAYEMVQQGKPMEAEYVLEEGGCGQGWIAPRALMGKGLQGGDKDCLCCDMSAAPGSVRHGAHPSKQPPPPHPADTPAADPPPPRPTCVPGCRRQAGG